jgi:hypothetical protein
MENVEIPEAAIQWQQGLLRSRAEMTEAIEGSLALLVYQLQEIRDKKKGTSENPNFSWEN